MPSQLREVPSGLGPVPEREAGFLLCHCLDPENSGKPGWIEEGSSTRGVGMSESSREWQVKKD